MPKYSVTLARLVRETVSITITAKDGNAAREKADEIYEADEIRGKALDWQSDLEWGADKGTHTVKQED